MSTYETHDLEVCSDCMMLLANGETPPDADVIATELADDIDANWPSADGWHVVPGDCGDNGEHSVDFSMSACDACRSPLGGPRCVAHAIRLTT